METAQNINPKTDALFWMRRDLRLHDNAGLFHVLNDYKAVQIVFIFDSNILEQLPEDDARVSYIHKNLEVLQTKLTRHGASILVHYGTPESFFTDLNHRFPVLQAVYYNKDYEPYAIKRDASIEKLLQKQELMFKSFKDHVIFEEHDILKDDGSPYVVFSPYAKRWRDNLRPEHYTSFPSEKHLGSLCSASFTTPSLESMGFINNDLAPKPYYPIVESIVHYGERRDFPAIEGTTKVSVHLRFGTISIRKLLQIALKGSPSYLNELVWRDFYQMIIFHFPHSATSEFKPKYAQIPWRNNAEDFERWKAGKTGVALVDAGMRELNATGFMHNRVRMVVASFLVKNLLLDWRLGEAYFAEKLLDYELASNVGGWQWAAGSGCDAAPYFRVFNPDGQAKKFDPKMQYICKWVPEFESLEYRPMVDLKGTRVRCIETFKKALS